MVSGDVTLRPLNPVPDRPCTQVNVMLPYTGLNSQKSVTRAVIKGRGPGIPPATVSVPPGYCECAPRLLRVCPPATVSVPPRPLLLENKRICNQKISLAVQFPAFMYSVVFTRQLEILVTTLRHHSPS